MTPKKKPTPSDIQKEILNYLSESGASRYRRPKFSTENYIEDYGTGMLPDFNNPLMAGPNSEGLEQYQETPDIMTILNYLAKQDETGRIRGTSGIKGMGDGDGWDIYLPKSFKDHKDPIHHLVNYEENIHGMQANKPFDVTLGRGVGRAKRKLKKAVKEAFTPEMMRDIYLNVDPETGKPSGAGLKGYVLTGPNSKVETEAKAISLKATLRKFGILDSPQMVDSDLDKISAFYQDNPSINIDAFSQLFNPDLMDNQEYRKSLLDFMNRF